MTGIQFVLILRISFRNLSDANPKIRICAMNNRFHINKYKRTIRMIFYTFMIASLTSAAAFAANDLPPIDIAATSEFETISFGLG
jgi:hypothetical protein